MSICHIYDTIYHQLNSINLQKIIYSARKFMKEEELELFISNLQGKILDTDIVVTSPNQAILIVKQFLESNEYDLYRGQSGLWTVVSSFIRLDETEQKKALEKYEFIDSWLQEKLNIDDPDKRIAIAQHYHIPTNFVDFTTNPDVAMYFATEESGREPNEYACIICINTKEFNDNIKIMKQYEEYTQYPEILDIDVDNLWRLQAQEGKFLYLPSKGFEIRIPYKRIVFPRNSNYKNALNKDYIYPRKSKLEEQLDMCFQAERMHFAMPRIYEFADSLQIPVYQATFDSYMKEAVNEKELCSFSWDQSVSDNWGNPIVENYKDAFTYETIVVDVVLNKDEFNIDEKIYDKVLLTLNNDLEIRNKLISWKFKLDGKDIYYLNNSTNIMNQLWDGIRNLPYSNHEVALIIKKSMHYFRHDYHNIDIKNIFDDQITIVVSDKIGSFNKAYVSRKKLSNTIRKDLNNVLIDKVDDLERNLEKVIMIINQTNLLYDFLELKNLFIESIILTQLFNQRNDPIFFSPIDVDYIGLP